MNRETRAFVGTEGFTGFVAKKGKISIPELLVLAKDNKFCNINQLEFLVSFNATHIMLNKTTLISIVESDVTESVAKMIEKAILAEIHDPIPINELKCFESLRELPDGWDEWCIYSIIRKWSDKLEVMSSCFQWADGVPVVGRKGGDFSRYLGKRKSEICKNESKIEIKNQESKSIIDESKTVKFSFDGIDESKREAIRTTEGPLLIIAGPGTGKTYTIVKRALYLITECGVSPKEILLTTFSEKAARELVTRISGEMSKIDKSINVNEMYIGTIHGICLRLLKENLEYTRLQNNYRIIDDFEQRYFVFQNYKALNSVSNFEVVFPPDVNNPKFKRVWKNSEDVCRYLNKLTEEMVDVSKLASSDDVRIQVLAEVYRRYQNLLKDNNLLDFASIQKECVLMLKNNQELLDKLHSQIKYLMIDEYQDTNYIQEQFVFLLGRKYQNICVVGDDDQSLYRFRGATVRNILEFPNKFAKGQCKEVHISENYRSNPDIVEFYNRWMRNTNEAFSWTDGTTHFRFDKTIVAHNPAVSSPGVVVMETVGKKNEIWNKAVFDFIQKLKMSGKITDYNQIAFLFRSVKNRQVKTLAKYLEKHGMKVYSPRSEMFFERREVKIVIGCFLCMFPFYFEKLIKGEYCFSKGTNGDDDKPKLPPHQKYLQKCEEEAVKFLAEERMSDLSDWIDTHKKRHQQLVTAEEYDKVQYAFTTLMYQLFQFEPFSGILSNDLNGFATDTRAIHNLALLSKVFSRYEYLHDITIFNSNNIKSSVEGFFNFYLKFLHEGGITEYEDDSTFAPSGCISFMTIHQSKGLEFPIVVVGSLNEEIKESDFIDDDDTKANHDEIFRILEDKYYNRQPYEPYEYIPYFDLWRLYYTAFSRPKNLLVLTHPTTRSFSGLFYPAIKGLADVSKIDLSVYDFAATKDTDLKDVFSFTSHVSVYDTCPLQYKFFKELEFVPVRDSTILFGTLVHETIEDVHKAAIRGDYDSITVENVTKWLNANYAALLKKTKRNIDEESQKTALEQVLKYIKTEKFRWSKVREAEVEVSYVMDDYIMEGKIDLVRSNEDGYYEIIDFKSQEKPESKDDRNLLEHYKQQLIIYAYLLEKNHHKKISKMHLYFTGAKDSMPYVTIDKVTAPTEQTINFFTDIVHKIKRKEFVGKYKSNKTCQNCDFRYYCKKKSGMK